MSATRVLRASPTTAPVAAAWRCVTSMPG